MYHPLRVPDANYSYASVDSRVYVFLIWKVTMVCKLRLYRTPLHCESFVYKPLSAIWSSRLNVVGIGSHTECFAI